MSRILTTDVPVDPPNPAARTHTLYTKAAGLFVKDSTGTVVGPLSTGGGLAPPSSQDQFLFADSTPAWVAGLPPRVKFAGPSRISILGDLGGLTDPQSPRVVNSVGVDVNLGYLARTQYSAFPAGGGAPPGTALPDGFTFYEVSLIADAWYLLPDCRVYPPGTEIVVVNATNLVQVARITADGGGDANRAIIGPSTATGGTQDISPDYSGRRFLTNGSGWILIGAF
jgi:hypothetical protein